MKGTSSDAASCRPTVVLPEPGTPTIETRRIARSSMGTSLSRWCIRLRVGDTCRQQPAELQQLAVTPLLSNHIPNLIGGSIEPHPHERVDGAHEVVAGRKASQATYVAGQPQLSGGHEDP